MLTELESLTAGLNGLTAAEVEERRARGETNATAAKVSRSYRRILLDNAFTPVNTILFVISIALIALGLFGDAVMTAGLVLINVVAGSVQEGRAKRRLDQISLLVRPRATVLRDGREQEIQPQDIVLGDLLLLQSGDEVQVDGEVLREEGFSVDESLLTGESDAVRKHQGDRVYSGSFCTAGRAVFRADRIGAESMAQQLTLKARRFRNVQTPLQREVGLVLLSMAVFVAILGATVAGSFLNLYGGLPLRETVRAAAVIVALIPQGLAFMITVTYAVAAVRIARSGALVQRMNAVESISHIDTLCLDKTGTLTSNRLAFEAVRPFGIAEEDLRALLGRFAAAVGVRNKTTDAILEACLAPATAAVGEVPFDSGRKWSALAFEAEPRGIYFLGAPEILASRLDSALDVESETREWTARGLRVLLFARLPDIDQLRTVEESQALPRGLEPLGLVALRDELRHEAKETVEQFARAGIELKVLSGDHPETVAALARQTGIGATGSLVSGRELDELDEEAFAAAADEATIFGRISPDHKEKLVAALQKKGRYVAMIGDGVNDIPALKRANVAVAMRSGSPATRQIADIVLLNDSFSVLPAAFQEGQRIRNGMQTIIRLFLVRTLSVSLVILGAALLGNEFPTTPRQAGLPALFTVGIPALVLAFWAKPGRTQQYLLPSSATFVLPAALTLALTGLAVYHGFLQQTGDLTAARTAYILTAVACGLLLIPYVTRPTPARGLAGGNWHMAGLGALMLACMFAVLFVEPLQRFYELETLTPAGYAAVAFAVACWAAVLHLVWVFGSRIAWPQSLRSRLAPAPAVEPPAGARESGA